MLPDTHRLRKKNDIQRVYKKGHTIFSQNFVVKVSANESQKSRFTFVISQKVAKKATDRNRLKRQLREIIRLRLGKIQGGSDAVFIIKRALLSQKYEGIEQEVLYVLRKAHLLLPSHYENHKNSSKISHIPSKAVPKNPLTRP